MGRTGRGGGRWLAVLSVGVLAGCTTSVLHGVDERAANEAVGALERAGIGAEKIADDAAAGGSQAAFTVRVAVGDGGRALDLLRAVGLPHDRRRGFAESYGQPSLIPTASEERARYLDALAGEIERTLEAVDGVVSARVHLVPEEADPLAVDPGSGVRPRSAARAAVLLKARAGRTPIAEADVQRLVSGSVPGLEPAAVAVVTTAAAEPAEPAPALASVGPLRVTPASRRLLILALSIALAVLAAMAAMLLMTARRLARLERARDEDGPSPLRQESPSPRPAGRGSG
jgi:type III secretion protein J